MRWSERGYLKAKRMGEEERARTMEGLEEWKRWKGLWGYIYTEGPRPPPAITRPDRGHNWVFLNRK